MFTRLAFLTLTGSVGLAFSTPVLPRDTCRPNFEGNAQTIFRTPGRFTYNQWTPSAPVSAGGHVTITSGYYDDSFWNGEFFIPFTGTSSGTYQIKAVADSAHAFALAGAASGDLSFKRISYTFPNKQEFLIDCASCPEPGSNVEHTFAEECIITHAASGKCVTGIAGGVTLSLETCTGANEQSYTITSGPTA